MVSENCALNFKVPFAESKIDLTFWVKIKFSNDVLVDDFKILKKGIKVYLQY